MYLRQCVCCIVTSFDPYRTSALGLEKLISWQQHYDCIHYNNLHASFVFPNELIIKLSNLQGIILDKN